VIADYRQPDGTIPPNTTILGPLMAEVLRYAAEQAERQCVTVHQAITMLNDMAAAYAEEPRRGRR
jgi:hypothetical protein